MGRRARKSGMARGKRHDSAGRRDTVLRAAIVFPQIKWIRNFPTRASFADENIDFVIFPEAYINPPLMRPIKSLKGLAADLDATLLVGATDNRVDSTDRYYQILLRIDPDGWHKRVYVKHSSADAVAFERSLWTPDSMLPTFDLAGARAGTTICHDHYLGLLPRFLASCGAQIYINPSFNNVDEIKWSSVLRLRAVENRMFSLCTLHDDLGTSRTHPFAFSPDGHELLARRAGGRTSRPLSACRDPDSIYIVELDLRMVDEELAWGKVPTADELASPRPQKPPNTVPKMPVRVRQFDGQPTMHCRSKWQGVEQPGCDLDTDHGSVYVGIVPEDQILDAAACFRVIDRAKQANCIPIIWNVWGALPAESSRLATLMLGRAIECCAPVIISDRNRIHELVELSSNYKIPTRRPILTSGEAIVNLEYAKGLDSAFRIVRKDGPKLRRGKAFERMALERYRRLA
ncbi:MAG: carbon-nitrogen hydrolase family protein [Gemmatimonadota bacterium]|nr:carbon-nitrogen hydrolase family protein [Gemmatimonadota bacterium]